MNCALQPASDAAANAAAVHLKYIPLSNNAILLNYEDWPFH